MVGKCSNGMHQVVTKIWTLIVVARKTLTIISKLKKGNNLHHMQNRVILIYCVYKCEIGKGCITFQYNASRDY